MRETNRERVELGRYILASLELFIVSDIIHTALSLAFADLLFLGLLVVIRSVISYFLDRELDQLRKELGDAIEFVQPQGGLFVWALLTGAGGKVADGNVLAKRAIEKGVAFVPGTPFFCANPDHATFRLSFATADVDKIREGVERLGQAI